MILIHPLTGLKGNQIGAAFWYLDLKFIVDVTEGQKSISITDSILGKLSPANTVLTDLVCEQPQGNIQTFH
jgi:hypothetical protein